MITIRPFEPHPVAFSPVSADAAGTAHGTYGDLVMHSDGSYNYVANAAYDALTAGQVVTDVFKYGVDDGHGGVATSFLTITITGTNDAPVLTADAVSVRETSAADAGQAVMAGTVLGNDTDAEGDKLSVITIRPFEPHPVAFSPVSADAAGTAHGTYGDLVMHSDGSYSYVANAAYDALTAGQVVTDVFKYGVDDGHGGVATSFLTITITGTNDTAVITGTTTGSVTEAGVAGDGTPNASGDLNSTDVDNTADAWNVVSAPTASTNGYGTYTIDATGHWSYAVSNSNATVNALNNGQHLTDTFTVQTIDGTAQVVTVTINGADDAAANQPPVASDVTIITDGDNGKTISIPYAALALERSVILTGIRFQ